MNGSRPSRTLIYVGPTLPAEAVLQLLPQAELRPPIAAGDLALEGLQAGDRVALIDGVFLHKRAVRHKELAVLLQRGVQVLGASSMGALRAVEMAPFGMLGFGTVVQWFRDGRIDGDDEVALLHGDAELGHRPLGEALVNLRACLTRAQAAGCISGDTASGLLSAWKALPFHQRDRPALIAVAQEQEPHLGATVRNVLEQHGCDLKRQDAEELLNALRDGQIPVAAANDLSAHVRDTQVDRLIPWICWQLRDEPVDARGGVADSQVLAAARLLGDDYPSWHRGTAVRGALQDAGITEAALPGLQAELELSNNQCDALLDLLVQRGLIDHPDDLPQLAADLCDDPTSTNTSRLLVDFIGRTATGYWWQPRTLEALVASGQAAHWRQVAEAADAHLERIRRCNPAFQPKTLNSKPILAWCREHWLHNNAAINGDESDRAWRLAMRDRGFNSEAKLCSVLAAVFPYAHLVSDPFGLQQTP
jgi:hypothetical protein